MKSNLSEIVSKYLFTYGKVSIPGIGTFSISDSSSGFKLKDHVLTPPTRMIDFSEEVTDEEGLIKYLKTNHDLSRKAAEQDISEYSKNFLNDLLNYGVANIPGIGRLSKYASGEIVFDPAKAYLVKSNYMLPEIKLSPIDNTAIAKELDISPAKVATAVPVVLASAALLNKPKVSEIKQKLIEGIDKVSTTSSGSPVAQIEKSKEFKKESKPITPPISKERIKDETISSSPIRRTPPPIVYEEEPSFFSVWKWPLLIGLILLGLSIFGIKMCKKYISAENIAVSNPLIDKDDEIAFMDSEDSTTSEDDVTDFLEGKPKLEKYREFLSKEIIDEGCIVILGTFNKSRNVIKLKDRIIRAGYSPYTESMQGMTRVGVLFQCEEYDLEDHIRTLRRSFSRDAWYLIPEMDVAKR